MIQRPNFAFYQDPNNDITYYSPEQSNALENQWLSSPEGVVYTAQNARQTQISADPLYQAITRGIGGVVNGQEGYSPWDQGNIEALYNQVKAGGTGLDANSDWTGLMQNMQNRQFGQFGNWSHDSAQVVPKFWDYNGLDPNRTQINNYLSGADYREKQGLDDWRNAMGEATPTGGLLGAPDMFYKFAAAAASMGAAGMAGAGAGTAATGGYATGGSALTAEGASLASAYGGGAAAAGAGAGGYSMLGDIYDATSNTMSVSDGGGMYDNLYGDSADLIDAYGGNQSTLGNVDEFSNNIYGGQTSLGGTEYNDFGGDPLGGTNNAPIPAEGIQKLVDAGVPWEIASKMSISGLKSLLSLAQSKGGSAGGNNPWAKLLAAGLGVLGSRQQTNSLNNLSQQFANYGAPSRARYESSYQPGFTMANDPGFTDALNLTSKASANAQSVTNGNPTGSPNAQMQINKDIFSQFAYPALQNYRNQNASTGGIASFNAAAPSAATAAVGSNANTYNAIGAGINDIFNPKPTLAQSMADYQRLSAGIP